MVSLLPNFEEDNNRNIAMKLQDLNQITQPYQTRAAKMPLLFIGHGHPVNALLDTGFSRALIKTGRSLEKPNAILVISAHWETVGTYVSVNQAPRTIHDFGPFSDQLYQMAYPAPGHAQLAKKVKEIISLTDVMEDHHMGLDHGAWTILNFIRPEADIPVFEMSIDFTKGPDYHFQLGQQLKEMRNKGVLIICSGNIVHNLRLSDWHHIDAVPQDWNLEFDEQVKTNLDQHNFKALVQYQSMGKAASMAIPTNDHYLPMLYCLGMCDKNEQIKHIYEGYQFGGISMRCFQAG